jgi:hypothetical protein
MRKANGKTTTLQLFLGSLSPKNMQDASSGNKLKIALFGELSLEEAMDLSRDRQIFELGKFKTPHKPHNYQFLEFNANIGQWDQNMELNKYIIINFIPHSVDRNFTCSL